MSLTIQDVQRIAKLARLDLSAEQQAHSLDELTRLLHLFDDLQSVDTTDVEPLAHPLSAIEEVTLRLRADEVTEPTSIEQRDALMANAPATEEGLFLVPKVIE